MARVGGRSARPNARPDAPADRNRPSPSVPSPPPRGVALSVEELRRSLRYLDAAARDDDACARAVFTIPAASAERPFFRPRRAARAPRARLRVMNSPRLFDALLKLALPRPTLAHFSHGVRDRAKGRAYEKAATWYIRVRLGLRSDRFDRPPSDAVAPSGTDVGD